jgi:hypothetical protein
MSCLIAWKTARKWRSYFCSSASIRAASSAWAASIDRSRTKARMISTFTAMARGLLSTLDSMATPCSVNAYGRVRRPPWPRELEVTMCDLKSASSAAVSRNMKSAGKRARFRRTAWFKALVFTRYNDASVASSNTF